MWLSCAWSRSGINTLFLFAAWLLLNFVCTAFLTSWLLNALDLLLLLFTAARLGRAACPFSLYEQPFVYLFRGALTGRHGAMHLQRGKRSRRHISAHERRNWNVDSKSRRPDSHR